MSQIILRIAVSSEVAAYVQQLLEDARLKPFKKNRFLRCFFTDSRHADTIDSVTMLPLATSSGHEAAASQTEEDLVGQTGLGFDSDE